MTSSPSRPGSPAWPGSLKAVVFDVGETLLDETTEYGDWADWLGVPRHTFSAVFGAVIAAGEDYRQVFQRFVPGFDLEVERRLRADIGAAERFGPSDLYEDARPCLADLRAREVMVGVAGNQTARAEQLLRELRLPVDWIRTSSTWGVEKPSPAFFERLVAECGCRNHEVAYVGDRVDNDIGPAFEAGLVTVHVRRGPWGRILDPDPRRSHLIVDDLKGLADQLPLFSQRR